MAEDDNLRRKALEEQGKRKKLEVKDFLLKQMANSVTADASSLPNDSSQMFNVQGTGLLQKKGKAMNIEELRLNKQLLKEISRRKKEKMSAVGHVSQGELGSVGEEGAANSY